MTDSIKSNVKSEKQWCRGLFMLLFLVVYEITEMILILLALVQFVFAIVTGSANENLTRFGDSLATYVRQLVAFLTYNGNEKPFPFADWPVAQASVIEHPGDDTPPTTGS